MLKVGDLIKKLEQFDKETKIKVKINDNNFYNEISSITFSTYLDNEFDDEIILDVLTDDYLEGDE